MADERHEHWICMEYDDYITLVAKDQENDDVFICVSCFNDILARGERRCADCGIVRIGDASSSPCTCEMNKIVMARAE